jgi:hypothetical protein
VVGMSIGPKDNIAATAAITAIRPPFRNEFLAPETDTPASAISGLRKNFDAIDKHDAGNCHSTCALSSATKFLEPKKRRVPCRPPMIKAVWLPGL